MIQIRRLPPPPTLTPALVSDLTAQFATDKTSRVWNRQDIKDALMRMSHSKCVYCEAKLDQNSHYMEVEHFYYKEMYPNLVVEWNNLLACCKRCNTAKGRHDVGIEPIVNPTTDDPRVHLSLRNYRFYPKTQIGKTTRDVLNLNDQQRAVQARFAVGELMANYSEELEEIAVKYTNNPTSRLRNKTSNKLEGALKEAAPEAQFGSTAATELKSNVNFSNAISILRSTDVWTPEIEKSYQCCIAISY